MEQDYRPSKDLRDAIVVISSTTTSDGAGDGTTLIDTVLTQGNDYWNNMAVVILSGSSIGQVRRISDFTAASDTILVDTAFASQIASGTKYNIIGQYLSSSSTSATVTTGTYTHANNTTENDALTITAATQDIFITMDCNALTKNTTIREYEEVDGSTARQLSAKIFPGDFDAGTKAIAFSFHQASADYKITFQSEVAEGATRDAPYRYRTESKA